MLDDMVNFSVMHWFREVNDQMKKFVQQNLFEHEDRLRLREEITKVYCNAQDIQRKKHRAVRARF